MKKFLFILTVILINFFAIGRSLQFSLSGDDWLALYRYIITFHTLLDHFNISKYMGNYDAANILMGLIYRLFEFNPFPYYLFSLIFRVLSSLSFYPPILELTKSRLAAILSVLFFSFSYIGIESTNWVFNMTTYISISLFNLFLYLYIKNKFTLKSTLIQTTILFMAFFFTPNRMHALIIIIPLLEILRFKFGHFKNLKTVLLRTVLFLIPIFIFRRLTASDWDQTYYQMAINFLSEPVRRFLYFLADISASLIPDRFLYLLIGDSYVNFLKTLIGGFFIITFPIFFYPLRKKYPNESLMGILSIIFALSFLLAPWLIFSNGGPFLSDSRYLTIPGAYFLVSIALFITIAWQNKTNIHSSIAALIIILFLITNLTSLNNYFNFYLNHGRDSKVANDIFSQISPHIKSYDNNAPVVFLFIADDYSMLYNAVTFGFSYHLMLIDPRFGMDIKKAPFTVDNMESLTNILTSEDSSELKRYGYYPMKIPLENIYAFTLQNKNLSNLTPQVRYYLKEKFSKKKLSQ